jgi:hypothetical protein
MEHPRSKAQRQIDIASAFPLENYACWQRKETEPKLQVIRTKKQHLFPYGELTCLFVMETDYVLCEVGT